MHEVDSPVYSPHVEKDIHELLTVKTCTLYDKFSAVQKCTIGFGGKLQSDQQLLEFRNRTTNSFLLKLTNQIFFPIFIPFSLYAKPFVTI